MFLKFCAKCARVRGFPTMFFLPICEALLGVNSDKRHGLEPAT